MLMSSASFYWVLFTTYYLPPVFSFLSLLSYLKINKVMMNRNTNRAKATVLLQTKSWANPACCSQ